MSRLTEMIARLRAWQVFVLLVGSMIMSQFYLTNKFNQFRGEHDVVVFAELFKHAMLLTFLMTVLLMIWVVSTGIEANNRIEQPLRPKRGLFLSSAIYASLYAFMIQFLFPNPYEPLEVSISIGLVFPLHILAVIAMFYTLVFTAKNLVLAEKQSKVMFGDYAGPFFQMWFFPIGVWFIQPRFNRLIQAKKI